MHAIHENTQAAKEMDRAIRVHEIQSLGETAPPIILSLAIRAIYESTALSIAPPIANTVISNVPGPPTQLYCGGARVAGIYSSSVILEGMGLNITTFSYDDRFDFGVHVDPVLVPDPFRVAENIPLALKELMQAAGLGSPRPVHDPFGNDALPREAV